MCNQWILPLKVSLRVCSVVCLFLLLGILLRMYRIYITGNAFDLLYFFSMESVVVAKMKMYIVYNKRLKHVSCV